MKNRILAFVILLLTTNLAAQEIAENEAGSWYALINKISITDDLYVSNVIQLRMVDFAENTRMLLLVPTINYTLNKHLTIGLGYGYIEYSEAGIRPPSLDYENRLFQQLSFASDLGKLKFGHRIRMEQRFKTKLDHSSSFANRFRYRLNTNFNILKLTDTKYLLARVSNELRIRFGSGLKEPEFDQNNFAALLGYALSNNSKFYVGYGRNLYKSGTSDYWGDHLLKVILHYDIDFTK